MDRWELLEKYHRLEEQILRVKRAEFLHRRDGRSWGRFRLHYLRLLDLRWEVVRELERWPSEKGSENL